MALLSRKSGSALFTDGVVSTVAATPKVLVEQLRELQKVKLGTLLTSLEDRARKTLGGGATEKEVAETQAKERQANLRRQDSMHQALAALEELEKNRLQEEAAEKVRRELEHDRVLAAKQKKKSEILLSFTIFYFKKEK